MDPNVGEVVDMTSLLHESSQEISLMSAYGMSAMMKTSPLIIHLIKNKK